MRLRQLMLALIALSGVWIAVLVERTQQEPASAVAVGGPHVANFKPSDLKRVPGLRRPVAIKPMPEPVTRPHVSTPAPAPLPRVAKPTPAVRPHLTARQQAPAKTVLIPEDSRSAAVTPTPPVEALAIADPQVTSLTSSSARITWNTNFPTQAQTAFGLDGPTVWAQPSGASLIQHESVLTGLDVSTTYQVYLHGVDEWNRGVTQTLSLTTGPMPSTSSARTTGDSIVVDDSPFFPTAVWAQCSDGFGSNISDGINLFMGDGCEGDLKLPGRLGGRAYSIVDTEHVDATGRGVIGWYYPDEWDAFLSSDVQRSDLANTIVGPRAGRVSFLTLTNHFYSKAAPLPQGKGMYPVLFSIPDVLGFDLYPLQVWCRPAFGDVFDAQAELHTGSGGKPTFQWIEVAPMEHPCKNHVSLNPSPATVRAETWLAVGGRRRRRRLLPEPVERAHRRRDRTHEPRAQGARARAARSGLQRTLGCSRGARLRADAQRRALRHRGEHHRDDRAGTPHGRGHRGPVGDGLRRRPVRRRGRRRLLRLLRAPRGEGLRDSSYRLVLVFAKARAFAKDEVRRFARNVRERSPRTPLGLPVSG